MYKDQSMKVCGVELKGNDAIICLLTLEDGLFGIPDCRVRKIDIRDANDAETTAPLSIHLRKTGQ